MINLKSLVYKILKDSRITSLISEDNILDAYPNKVETFPCIIFLDSNQNDIEFADNKPLGDNCSVDIHIFTKALGGYSTTSEIGITVAEVFTDNFFACVGNTEVSDPDPNVRHRVMNFRKEILS